MKCKIGLVVLLSLGLFGAANSSELSIPESFEFLAVDGKDVGSWLGSPRTVQLTEGEHKIALEYSATIADEANPRIEEFVHSEPLLITLFVEQGQRYRLVPHSSIKSAPRLFAENPRIKVMSGRDDANATVALLVKKDQSRWAKVTQSYSAPSKPQVSDMAKVTGSSSQPVIESIGATPAASMLVYWWNQADVATRESFLQQVNQ